jgi:sporulation protein YlmC with PRC-barrel domain
MKKTLSKILAVFAACAMLPASTWAQSQSEPQINPLGNQNNPPGNLSPDQSNRSWSTKHLSATGREDNRAVRASKLTGAQVSDSAGHRVGQIQDIILNPASGRIDFALLSLGTISPSPNSSGKLVPVPWALLRASASSQYAAGSEQPTFTLNADQNKLSTAPTVDWSDLSQSEWRQRIYSYYGATPQPSTGAAESPGGEMKGEGAMKSQGTPPAPQQQPNQ